MKKSDSIVNLAQSEIDRKTKPPGSLGIIEEVAVKLARIQGTVKPDVEKKRILVFAGSHGVAADGVSAFPSSVTGQMVLNFLTGGAAINVLARHGGIGLHVIDAGVDFDWPADMPQPKEFFKRCVRRGTRNFIKEPAMTNDECEKALAVGAEQVALAEKDGVRLLGVGEMGIGNTTSATVLFCALLGLSPDKITGRGTGIDDARLERKKEVVAAALAKYAGNRRDAFNWLACAGGFEIAATVGAILKAHELSIPIVIDGFIATSAAAVAFAIEPASKEVCFFSHRSDEQGHAAVLDALKARALLDLSMRLGEGTGAALAMHIIDASAKILCEMATFDSAGVSGKE